MIVLWAFRLTMLVLIMAAGSGLVSTEQPNNDIVAVTASDTQNSNVTFMNPANMTARQNDSVVTAEFILPEGQTTGTPNYAQIRTAVINEMNRRRPTTRKRRTRTSTVGTTTAEATTAETTTMEITTATTEETTTAETTTLQTTTETTTSTTEMVTTEPTTTTTTEEPPPVWARFRREVSDYEYYDDETEPPPYYTEDDLTFVLVEPLVVDGVLRVSFVVEKKDKDVIVDADEVLAAAETLQESGELEQQAGIPVQKVYRGFAPPGAYEIGTSPATLDWRFILALIFLLVLFIILICAVFWIRRREPHRPVPIDDSQSPMLHPECNSPCHQQPNGTGAPPFYLREDDCYIVPYDELLLARKDVKSPNASTISDLEHTRL